MCLLEEGKRARHHVFEEPLPHHSPACSPEAGIWGCSPATAAQVYLFAEL